VACWGCRAYGPLQQRLAREEKRGERREKEKEKEEGKKQKDKKKNQGGRGRRAAQHTLLP
jgi:hypothetical protein